MDALMPRKTGCLREAILNIYVHWHPCHHVIASMDGGTYDLSGTKIMTVDVLGCTNA
jgi:hypothetical protein